NVNNETIEKLKEKYRKQGIEEDTKRLSAYDKIDISELPEEKAPENQSDQDMKIVKEKEGDRILAKISPDTHVIGLAIEGKMKTSEELADK
ncbi:UNVERIFIED_CONTAM: 23S rRNA (pseudouridine(1915)-N(3))-methyltransferase RlmH, partial [Bacillus amyloliquefaciens DSM 7 = ATCC 23350]